MNLFAPARPRSLSATLLRLERGQRYMPGSLILFNCDWFDHSGRNLGWGDLSHDDLHRIQQLLREGEQFIVVRQVTSATDVSSSPSTLSREEIVRRHIERYWIAVVTSSRMYGATSTPRDPREIFAWHRSP